MTRDIFNGSTGNVATLLILSDATGTPNTAVVWNTAGLSIAYKIDTGSEVVITLSSGNFRHIGGGKYYVDVADSVYLAANLGKLIQFYGALTGSSIYGEQHRVVGSDPVARIPTFTEFQGRTLSSAQYATTSEAQGLYDQTLGVLGVIAGKSSDPVALARLQATDGGDTFNNATDSLEAQAEGGNCASTEDVEDATDAILAVLQGTPIVQVASPNVSGNLVLTQGDTYDGIGNPKAQWNVTTDYTDGWAVVLTIRDKDDAVVYTNTGTVVSATLISVAIDAPEGLEMEGCPGQWQGKFDVELTKATSVVTIAVGTCYINEDQTR
jgi:hypothetical protein